ncbi:MAG: LVIVD repeat-containing protein [Candidatus Dormibacteria bacterium]
MAVLGTVVGGLSVSPATTALATSAGTSSNFSLVGHDALFNRGENAAMAINGNYAYIGNRTDGSPNHLHPGVLIDDISEPTNPHNVGEIALTSVDPSFALGTTSRELRVWPQQNLLMVMYFGCSAILHACTSQADLAGSPNPVIAFFDIAGPKATSPQLVSKYVASGTLIGRVPQAFNSQPHEMFLWVDPLRAGRAMIYTTFPNNYPTRSLMVVDISNWRTGGFTETKFDLHNQFQDTTNYDVRLHSMSVSADGKRTYLAHLGGGFLVVDSSDIANNVAKPQLRLITPIANRVYWDNQGAHSSVYLPGRPYVFVTEEIYGRDIVSTALSSALLGCPWGWARVIDVHDETHPKLVAQYKIAENDPSYCPGVSQTQNNFSSYASHNPTVLPDVAILTWHSGGLQAVNLADPVHPTQAGFYLPTPETLSVTPDPALEPGSNNVIAWSYPIIKNGLIYYIDIRNGLYIVKYSGPHAEEVSATEFLEGNSSLGDAHRLDQPSAALRTAAESLVPNTSTGILPLRLPLVGSVLLFASALAFFAFSVRPRRRS